MFSSLVPAERLHTLARELLDQFPTRTGPARTFAEIELLAHAIGQQIAAQLTTELLADEAATQATYAPCPTCPNATRVAPKRRLVTTLDGPVVYHEPAAHCVVCRRDFFPSATRIGVERTHPES